VARKTKDEDNRELDSVLQELLNQNVDITAREVARRHSSFSSASTITRHPERRKLLENYQKHQSEMRTWQDRLGKRSKEQVAGELAAQQVKISELDETVRTLVTGHVALIAAVAQVGGMSKLSKFYENFREVRQQLIKAGAIADDIAAPELVKFPGRRSK
jgi:predicted metal-dependent hydrolase